MTFYLGIDPGASGGLALLGHGINTWKMPATERDIWDLFRNIPPDTFALIEKVHSMPRQGVASTFSFGANYGRLRMALIAAGIPFEDVTPARWQKAMGCLTGGNKNISKAKAQELFPELKISHAIADALLIAEYGRRLNERKEPDEKAR